MTFESNFFTDSEGNPAGGTTHGTGFCIGWQNGPTRGEGNGRNGAIVEELVEAVIVRLDYYQDQKFRCQENQVGADFLHMALEVFRNRTRRRELAGVEGTLQVQQSMEGGEFDQSGGSRYAGMICSLLDSMRSAEEKGLLKSGEELSEVASLLEQASLKLRNCNPEVEE